jgi:hypothetical protein
MRILSLEAAQRKEEKDRREIIREKLAAIRDRFMHIFTLFTRIHSTTCQESQKSKADTIPFFLFLSSHAPSRELFDRLRMIGMKRDWISLGFLAAYLVLSCFSSRFSLRSCWNTNPFSL